jgi:PAS domain-containing protein
VAAASGLIIRRYGTASRTGSPIIEPGAVIDTIPTFAWSTTPEGLAEFLNQRWREYTGLSLDQAVGYGWTKPTHPDDVSGIVSYWQTLITSGRGSVLTTYVGDVQVFRALKAGARGYILKGDVPRQLLDTIRAVHAGHKRIPP